MDGMNLFPEDPLADCFPEGCLVETRYPLNQAQHDGDREAWPWLPGTIVQRCGPDEWQVCVEDRRVAVRKDGSRPSPRTRDLYYPLCFRDASELRAVTR
jgi:hypothetical protein